MSPVNTFVQKSLEQKIAAPALPVRACGSEIAAGHYSRWEAVKTKPAWNSNPGRQSAEDRLEPVR